VLPDLLIVGGGAIGLSVADYALRNGLRVTVLDKSAPGREASWAGAGMITCRPRPRLRVGVTDYYDLTLLSANAYPQWAARLEAETGIAVGYRVSGALELLAAGESGPKQEMELAALLAGAAERGLAARRISANEAKAREPALDVEAISGALEFPSEAQVRNPWLVRALVASIEKRRGALQSNASVADILLDHQNTKVLGVQLASGERIEAANTVICAGAWSAEFPRLNTLAPAIKKVHPVRGQMLCYNADPSLAARLLTCHRHYIVPRGDGVILVGATHERAGFEKDVTPEGYAELTAFGHATLPALRKLEPTQRWAGLRPGLQGRHPLLGPVRGVERLFLACGHYRNGLTLAPATAELMVDTILGHKPKLAIDGWMA
jgi:glycine oxidase